MSEFVEGFQISQFYSKGFNSLTTSEKPGPSSKETVVQQLSSLSQICSDPVVGVLILKKIAFCSLLGVPLNYTYWF